MRRRSVLRTLLAVPAGAVAGGLLASPAQASWATIDPDSDRGTWEGWGTSLAWWAKGFGGEEIYADILFTREWPWFDGRQLPGLGLNIVRYNAGACSWNSVDGATMQKSGAIPGSRQIEGYWTDWYSSDPASSSWNWWADGNQRNMMWCARDRGANRFELFSNSPMWWMCANHNPSGSANGTDENLQSWNVQSHAIYLATIARYAHDNWGIDFGSVEPFNEPHGTWRSQGNQEGCHFGTGTQIQVINALRGELNTRDLWWIPVVASDECRYDDAINTWNEMDTATLGKLGRINVHGYNYDGGSRDGLHDLASSRGLKIWNSEYGESDTSGSTLARCLLLDFCWLHPTAWSYWQPLDISNWGLIDADPNTGRVGGVYQKYYVLAHFTRHIREGMRILDTGSDKVVAAYDASRSKLIIVAANFDSGQWMDFDMAQFSTPSYDGARVLRWSTHFNGSEGYADYYDTFVQGTRIWSWFDTGTVQTFEVDDVQL